MKVSFRPYDEPYHYEKFKDKVSNVGAYWHAILEARREIRNWGRISVELCIYGWRLGGYCS